MMKIKRRVTRSYFHIGRIQYAPLIQKLSFLICDNDSQSEEMRSRANDELLKCMICYDGRGSFMTFLYCRLNGVFRHIRDADRRARRIHSMPMDAMCQIAGSDNNLDSHIMVQEYLECLDGEERDIIVSLFFHNKTMREVSLDRGLVPSTICRIKTRAINKMRQRR